MPVWLRRTLVTLGALVVVAGAAYYWLIVESRMPSDADFPLDINQVRRAVAAVPGDKPGSVEVELIGSFQFPATAIVAGDGWGPRDVPVYSFRLVYPGTSILIDTALNEELGGGNLVTFDAEAYARMERAMAAVSLIVITHEHMDHIGGLTVHPELAAVLPSTKLTREQLAHPERSLPARFPEGLLEGYQPLDYEQYRVIAPGVALIKAPGHTPGSQMVYVQKANGEELLFLGDVAWHYRNIEVLRERARLMTQFFLKEDRTAVFGQLAALHRLHEAEPDIALVPGHDGGIVNGLLESGILKQGFAIE
ncbi:MAG: MBL fold metallo-hydrolase [Parvibaculum sp.]|uniref:MBL fold metallo-hydrolase n=1 Tax=Parvibaculum sp. TaxID=2024848 RepID=UPI002722F661|nr:MBL fold metallo-hydrolase [Parvibaculum sp.]MDO8838235.1 MBL fold metallo-hydrolase [Parvibaculum sp.]